MLFLEAQAAEAAAEPEASRAGGSSLACWRLDMGQNRDGLKFPASLQAGCGPQMYTSIDKNSTNVEKQKSHQTTWGGRTRETLKTIGAEVEFGGRERAGGS